MITKQRVYIRDFADKANKLASTFGKTELYTTGFSNLDEYLGGGYGREDGYEIVLIYGPTGIGKSLITLNLIAPAILSNVKVGMLILEDDMADASLRLKYILGTDDWKNMNSRTNVVCLPEEALSKSWKLEDLLEYIEHWFTKENLDLILLDHLQFAFEGAESIKGENEYAAQRVFMQKLNQIVKRHNKTIILVSHVNKTTSAKGMDRIQGSGAIPQAVTKSIEVGMDHGKVTLWLRKTRFTKRRDYPITLELDGTRLKETK